MLTSHPALSVREARAGSERDVAVVPGQGSAIALQQAAEAMSGLDDRAGQCRRPMRLRIIDAEVRMHGVQGSDGELEQEVEGGEHGQFGIARELVRGRAARGHGRQPVAGGGFRQERRLFL